MLLFATIALYVAALLALLAGLRGRIAMQQGEKLSLALALPAVALHTVLLWLSSWSAAGVNLSIFNAASLLGWLMALMVVIAALRQPVHSLGLVVFPLAAALLALSYQWSAPAAAMVPVGEPVDAHVIASILAYAVLGLASAQALLLAWQDRTLRRRRAGAIVGLLPALQSMEALLFQLLIIGWGLLSLSLLTGWLFVDNLFAQDLVHKTVLSMTAWLVFAALLIGRHRAGWRGRTAIRWTLFGFALLALAYFGSKVVLELILAR